MPRKSRRREVDALVLLGREHALLRQLFREHAQLIRYRSDPDRQAAIVDAICLALSVHSQVVAEILYPAVRAATGRQDAAAPAATHLQTAHALMARLDEMEPGDPEHDATVAQLGACVLAHMDEEQDDVFPRLQAAGLDTAALGRQMAQRQRELRDDVTRVGQPRAGNDVPTWPASCRLAMH